jgi:glycosyltransferase involved in cell wall biosynthesis
MAALCFVTSCMGRLAPLRRTLDSMVRQPGGSCIVVDYSCPDGAGDWVEANHPGVRVVRVPGQSRFNASAARNAGARHAEADWICFVDSDVVLEPGFTEMLLPTLGPGGFYRTWSDDRGLGGTFACSRADFERAGGYDEVYPCWGEEDNDLYDALQFLGLEARALPASMLRHLSHGDEERTRYYPVADRILGHAVNRVYRIVKWDAARLRRELPGLDMRRSLYETISEVVTASIRSGRPGDLALHLPPGIVPGGGSLSRSMSYRLTLDP